ncbi:MAG: hypothetical protein HFH03_01425 [Dorea sp.]|jgi:hypothetical protein|nr:hypothetical protein [Dorea sp.]
MRNKYGIGFLSVMLILALAVTFAYQYSYRIARERTQARLKAAEEVKSAQSEETVTADGHALKEDCYYLKNVNGYVVVFLSDKKTAYEYTDILCEELPQTIQEELVNGKYIETQEDLYGFLENYSS